MLFTHWILLCGLNEWFSLLSERKLKEREKEYRGAWRQRPAFMVQLKVKLITWPAVTKQLSYMAEGLLDWSDSTSCKKLRLYFIDLSHTVFYLY